MCTGCKSDKDLTREKERSFRAYVKTQDGVRYFTTCIEGFKFVATHTAHRGFALAGPIGDCS